MEENKSQINNKNNIKTVRTYMSDMADTVRENEISVIKVALAEQNKHSREDIYRQAEGTPTKKILLIVGGLILLAGAIYGSYFILNESAKKNAPQQIIKTESIISYNETSHVVITDKDSLINKIKLSINEKSGLGINESIKLISIEKETNGIKENFGIQELFSKIGFSSPSSLVRSLSDSYMTGTYTKNTGEATDTIAVKPSFFLILQSKEFEFTYAGMLEWEKTMAGDMLSLFKLNTTDNMIKVNERKWKDIIINNKDARVLYNEENKPILYYIFVDKTNLVITDSEGTIGEITRRLIMKNIKPL